MGRRLLALLLSLVLLPGVAGADAVTDLAERLRAQPADRMARDSLRHVAAEDPDALARARAWEALLAVGDDRFTWQRLVAGLRSPAERERMLETLLLFDMPVLSELLESLPDVLPRTLLDIAATSKDTRLRIRAIETASRIAAWALDLLSRGYLPDEARQQAIDHARAQDFLKRFSRLTEAGMRALLADSDEEVRRAAAGYFVVVPAREPATAEALLAATRDPNPYVRDNAAMALANVRHAPPGFAQRVAERIAQGDPDPNVARKLRDANAAALCSDPRARDGLAAVILHRKGDRFLRQALAARCRLEGKTAIALLDRLDGALVRKLVSSRGWSIADLVRAEEDPPPWVMLQRMVPAEARDTWLLEQAADASLGWKQRIALLANMENLDDPDVRQRLLDWLVAGVREGGIDANDYLQVFASLGYIGIRTLAEAFVRDPEGLARAWEIVRQAQARAALCAASASSCGSVPAPGAEDVPAIARLIRAVANDNRRLGLLVRLLNLYALGQDPELRRLAREAGITSVLLEAMQRPGGCRAVRPAIHSLQGQMMPPECD